MIKCKEKKKSLYIMKKILLIEDRIKRQNDFLELHDISLEHYSDILVNLERERLFDTLEDIVQNNINFEEFDIIICHKSIEYNDKNSLIISNLKDYCKKSQKTMVLFSGGISVNFYDDGDLELLELNSKIFYSQNLSIFLEAVKSQNEDVTMLCYGKEWKENIVANTLEKTNLFITDMQNGIEFITNFQLDPKLTKLQYEFYRPKENNIDEIRKYKNSLEKYFQLYFEQNFSNNSVIIHHDNVCNLQIFNHHIKFIHGSDDIDSYISNEIFKDLCSKEFDTIFIKDNLSSNYLELLGLRAAYHIRLSSKLEDKKRLSPIVIISDFTEYTLNKFSIEANILFTQGIYLCKNTDEDIKFYQSLKLNSLENYGRFLETINIQRPKDTSGNHEIANKWSIYKWSEILCIESNSIIKNKKEIEDTLYFKYLRVLNKNEFDDNREIEKPTKKGKVLLIDDEWNKGWNDIIGHILSKDGIDFETFEYDFKDKTQSNLFMKISKKINEFNPDVVVLDLRLSQEDHESEDIDNYTGIKILQKIHELNAGIQVIMLTATSKSTILEKLYKKKILGYIKKEHPEDKSINTFENINKFIGLIDEGLKRKYLKDIHITKIKILDLLNIDFTLDEDELDSEIFKKFSIKKENYLPNAIKLYKESENIFDILDSNKQNSFIYAMLSITSSLETLLEIFMDERQNTFWDGEAFYESTVTKRHRELFFDKFGFPKQNQGNEYSKLDVSKMVIKRNYYLHSKRTPDIQSQEVVSWFNNLFKMIEIIKKPPNLRTYTRGDINNLIGRFNN